jgi:Carbohydrate family 9 binding domain-like
MICFVWRSSAEGESLIHRSPETRMRGGVIACVLVLIAAQILTAAEPAVMESTKAREDVVPSTDPAIPFWRGARSVYADKAPYGQSQPRYRTEIRSRWTEKNLYFLFVCPYEALNLKPSPDSASETYQLWDWDVAEVFIGSDFQNIRRYKEFEISPQEEWVDLDIDLSQPHHEDGWKWNSGFTVAARIDPAAKIWYGAMRIPFSALLSHAPSVGDTFRINLFRSQGPPPNRIEVVWQPTMSSTFHVPEKFGLLRLIAEGPL